MVGSFRSNRALGGKTADTFRRGNVETQDPAGENVRRRVWHPAERGHRTEKLPVDACYHHHQQTTQIGKGKQQQ